MWTLFWLSMSKDGQSRFWERREMMVSSMAVMVPSSEAMPSMGAAQGESAVYMMACWPALSAQTTWIRSYSSTAKSGCQTL